MKYSNAILTDDNFDDELEKMCGIVGMSPNYYEGFWPELGDGFTANEATGRDDENLGFTEFAKTRTLPSKGCDFRQAREVGHVAYEFGNGFMVLNWEGVL